MYLNRLYVGLWHLGRAIVCTWIISLFLRLALIAQKVGDNIPQIVTSSGLQFQDCIIKRMDADGLFIFHSKGVRKIKFTDLPPEWREKFSYDEKAAAEFEKADALKQREIGLGTSARQSIAVGKVTGRFSLQYPKALSVPLSELFRSTRVSAGTGTAVFLREETRTISRANALGGQGLPDSVTHMVEETKNLGTFLIVGNENDFNRGPGQDQTIFPIDQSQTFFGLDKPIYAFSAESAVAASVTLADIARKRLVPFTEKQMLGQGLETAMAQYDPFMRTVMAIRDGRLVERSGTAAQDPIALVTLDRTPRDLMTCCLVNDGRIDTVLYQSVGDGTVFSVEEILGLLDRSAAVPFEEIVPHGSLEVIDDSGAIVIEDWFKKTGVSKVYWSEDGTHLVLAVLAPNETEKYHAVWVTSRLEQLLSEIKEKTPREFWWSQVSGALSEFPPTIYETTFSGGTGLDSF